MRARPETTVVAESFPSLCVDRDRVLPLRHGDGSGGVSAPVWILTTPAQHDVHVVVDRTFERIDPQHNRIAPTLDGVPHARAVHAPQLLGGLAQQARKNGASLNEGYRVGPQLAQGMPLEILLEGLLRLETAVEIESIEAIEIRRCLIQVAGEGEGA